jgi:hypothetical protein
MLPQTRQEHDVVCAFTYFHELYQIVVVGSRLVAHGGPHLSFLLLVLPLPRAFTYRSVILCPYLVFYRGRNDHWDAAMPCADKWPDSRVIAR